MLKLNRKDRYITISTAYNFIASMSHETRRDFDFIASERLFLDNPTMDGAAPAGTGLRGDGQKRYSLVGDHVSVLPVLSDVTSGSLRRAIWSPTKLCYAGYTPHEGCQDASLPSAIVGLMRNNLSEVYTSLPEL